MGAIGLKPCSIPHRRIFLGLIHVALDRDTVSQMLAGRIDVRERHSKR